MKYFILSTVCMFAISVKAQNLHIHDDFDLEIEDCDDITTHRGVTECDYMYLEVLDSLIEKYYHCLLDYLEREKEEIMSREGYQSLDGTPEDYAKMIDALKIGQVRWRELIEINMDYVAPIGIRRTAIPVYTQRKYDLQTRLAQISSFIGLLLPESGHKTEGFCP